MPKMPSNLGKYKITDRLGRGGMSVLYKAEHPSLGTPVVIKKLTLKGDPAHRERFRREASLMMDLRHENVVGVFDHFREGSGHYLVMEFVDGFSLSDLLAREGALEPEDADWLIGKVASALAHIHGHGVVHRDIKPSNILISVDGMVKLADFGIAFVPGGGEDITAEGTALGTPSFMSPEQLVDARQADERSDIWSLGVCYFELLTGRKFVTGPTPAAIREQLPDAVRTVGQRIPPQLPRKSRRLIRKTLRMNPDVRLRDGKAVLRLLGGSAASVNPPSTLGARLDAMAASLGKGGRVASEETPDIPAVDEPAASGSGDGTSEKVAALRSLFFTGAGSGRKDSGKRFRGTGEAGETAVGNEVDGKKKPGVRRLALIALAVLLPAVLTIALTPARLFAPRTHGILVLELTCPDSVPEYWLDGAEVRLYREAGDGLRELVSPGLRSRRENYILGSRRLSLPAGAYRVSWSLGDTMSWTAFRLPSVSEAGVDSGATLTVSEKLGLPPVFPLDLEWKCLDAEDRRDISSVAVMSWERLDGSSPGLESGGRYRFAFRAPGYSETSFVVPVSPWRRHLRLDASLWRVPGRVIIRNDSDRTSVLRVNDSGSYRDGGEDHRMKRPGRLSPGDETELLLSPGTYRIAPGFDRKAAVDVVVTSGGDTALTIESDDERRLFFVTN